MFPGSKFILTLRKGGVESLVESDIAMWKRIGLFERLRAAIKFTSASVGNLESLPHHDSSIDVLADWVSDRIRTRYNEHVSEVRAYFASRPNDLIEITLGEEVNPWGKISSFLDTQAPANKPFPRSNSKDGTMPSVSIIMPTNGRPELLEAAMERIARQTYPKNLIKDVIIVDDSKMELRLTTKQVKKLQDVVGKPTKLVYKVLDQVASIGEKRNIAVSLARGKVIAHWDDDDFYGPDRLRLQIDPLAQGSADITVLPHTHNVYLADGTVFESKSKVFGWGPHFGTLVYRKSLWNTVKFNDWSLSEDVAFALSLVKKLGYRFKIISDAPKGTFLVSRHDSNTWQWGKVHLRTVARRLRPNLYSAASSIPRRCSSSNRSFLS